MQLTELLIKGANASVVVFVVSSTLSVGLALTLQQIVTPLRNGRLVALSLLANFVLGPIVAIGLAAHAILDAFHGHLVTNPAVPDWWPAFCIGFDVAAAAWLFAFGARRAPATVFAKLLEAQ